MNIFQVSLNGESLDLVLQRADLAHEVACFVAGDGTGDDCTGDALDDGKESGKYVANEDGWH